MNQEDFGPRLRKIRRFRKLTQKDISNQLNISRQAYSNYEQGRCMPPPNVLADLSILLNTNLFLLFIQDALTHQNIHSTISHGQGISEIEINSLVNLYSEMPIETRLNLLNHILPELPEREE